VIYISFQVFLCDTARPIVMNDIIGPIHAERHTSFASLAPRFSLPRRLPDNVHLQHHSTCHGMVHEGFLHPRSISTRPSGQQSCIRILPGRHDLLLMSHTSFPILDCDRQSVAGLRDGAEMTSLVCLTGLLWVCVRYIMCVV